MRNIIKVLGIIAITIIIVFSFTAVSCFGGGGKDSDGGSGGRSGSSNTDPKKITITGLPGKIDATSIWIHLEGLNEEGLKKWEIVAAAFDREISNNSITFSLCKGINGREISKEPWTGSGSYTLEFMFSDDNGRYTYYYTNGKSWTQLGAFFNNYHDKLPLYDIKSATSTIPFSHFRNVGEVLK